MSLANMTQAEIRALGGLALSCAGADESALGMRALAWYNSILSLGINVPLHVVLDLGAALLGERAEFVAPRDLPRLPEGINPAEAAALPAPVKGNARFLALALGSAGVVYGDIGTSPLYAFKESISHLRGAGGALATHDVLGVISLMFWALMVIVTVKYVLILMAFDNREIVVSSKVKIRFTGIVPPSGWDAPEGWEQGDTCIVGSHTAQ